MKRLLTCLVALLVLLGAASVSAQEKARAWETDLALSYTTYGGAHKVGGVTLGGVVGHVWTIDDKWSARAEGRFSFFGFGDELHWAGILGGPAASVSVRPWSKPIALTLGVQSDFGQLPGCNDWPDSVCMKNTGWFPAASFAVDVYAGDNGGLTAWFQVRDINTVVGHWAGLGGGLGGRLRL